MDTSITRAEHEEFRKTIDSNFQRIDDENKRQNRRIELLETNVIEMGQLTTTVTKLTINLESMLKVQEQQGKRLDTIEGRDGEMWRKAIGYVLSGIIGAIICFIFTRLGM